MIQYTTKFVLHKIYKNHKETYINKKKTSRTIQQSWISEGELHNK